MTHADLDGLVARFLAENPTARPSTATVLELLQWSARRIHTVKCEKCGAFLSATRAEMNLRLCGRCEGRRN